MTLTLEELKERLAALDEVYLMELLGLTSQDLIDRFGDLVEDRYDELLGEVEIFEEEE